MRRVQARNRGRQLPYALQLENLKLINERVIPQLK